MYKQAIFIFSINAYFRMKTPGVRSLRVSLILSSPILNCLGRRERRLRNNDVSRAFAGKAF